MGQTTTTVSVRGGWEVPRFSDICLNFQSGQNGGGWLGSGGHPHHLAPWPYLCLFHHLHWLCNFTTTTRGSAVHFWDLSFSLPPPPRSVHLPRTTHSQPPFRWSFVSISCAFSFLSHYDLHSKSKEPAWKERTRLRGYCVFLLDTLGSIASPTP
jgi:hypothetical protein